MSIICHHHVIIACFWNKFERCQWVDINLRASDSLSLPPFSPFWENGVGSDWVSHQNSLYKMQDITETYALLDYTWSLIHLCYPLHLSGTVLVPPLSARLQLPELTRQLPRDMGRPLPWACPRQLTSPNWVEPSVSQATESCPRRVGCRREFRSLSPPLSLLHHCCSGQSHLPPSLHCSAGGGLSCSILSVCGCVE